MTSGDQRSPPLGGGRSPWLWRVAAGISMVVLLAMGLVLAPIGLAAPLWALLVLMGFWLTLVVVGLVWFHRKPGLVVALPLFASVAWLLLIVVGEGLGWTA